MPRIPKYRHHRGTGQAVIWLNGRDVYLGKHGTPESREMYDRLVAEWLAAGRRNPVLPRGDLSVVELCRGHRRYAADCYRAADGREGPMMYAVDQSIRRLRHLYGSQVAAHFGPLARQAVRRTWIDGGLSRRTVNGYTSVIQRMFRWGAAQELVPASVSQALGAVGGLRRNGCGVKETEPVRPVPESHVEAVRDHVSRQVWSMIRFQLLTGARPGEVTGLRPVDLTETNRPVWVADVSDHKTAYADKDRVLLVGPAAQAVIRPFLADRPADACLFSPREAEKGRAQEAPTHRRQAQREAPRKTARRLGGHYTPASYRRALERACSAAGVPQLASASATA